MGLRIRQSIQVLIEEHDNGNTIPLENLIRAFRTIQALPRSDADSFESIAGYHGEPFVEEPTALKSSGDKTKGKYWGGYCHHNNILFPTWHRAYLLRLERALRDKGPDPNLALPFWDECAVIGRERAHRDKGSDSNQPQALARVIPAIFTSPTLGFTVDGSDANPLYSYKLKEPLTDVDKVYNKPAGYETRRYPLSGLVGTAAHLSASLKFNAEMVKRFPTADDLAEALNNNVRAWLDEKLVIDKTGDDCGTKYPDTFSVYVSYERCLKNDSYATFSNKATKNAELLKLPAVCRDEASHRIISLEEPHNSIHLSLGGFYEKASYNADPIRGANGDMGENNTAAFDPIFFFHHCFVDYMFWQWQIRHDQKSAIKLEIDDEDGFKSEGMPHLGVGTPLDFNTALEPMQKPNSTDMYTSNDVIDIENQLGYTYGPGSFSREPVRPRMVDKTDLIRKLIKVRGVDRRKVQGSFVIRTTVENKDGDRVEVGRSAILSRYQLESCSNCQNHLLATDTIPLHDSILPLLKGDCTSLDQLNVRVEIETRPDPQDKRPAAASPSWPASLLPGLLMYNSVPMDVIEDPVAVVTWTEFI